MPKNDEPNKKELNNEEIDKTKIYNLKKKKKKKTKSKKKINKKLVKKILLIALLVFLILAGIAFGILYKAFKEAKLDAADYVLKYENSVVLDKDGKLIAVLSGDENREFISISEMSKYIPAAFVSIEDERFYDHMGVDVKRTIAATVKYAFSKIGIGSANYGGSTITQQVIKNTTQEKDRTWQRKVKEIARAYYLEKELSKDQILELYLNLIYMGGNTNIYGVEVASNYYFSKSAKDLDLAESAFLAGINNTPNSYDPFKEDNEATLERVKFRTKVVLDKMKELGKITDEEYKEAVEKVNAGLPFQKGKIVETIYSYHTDAAIMQIIHQLMEEKDLNYDAAKLYLYSGGFTIYTTQDTNIQNIMQEEFEDEDYLVSGREKDDNGNLLNEHSQAGMVLLDQETGYVLATCGGLGKKETTLGFNRGTQLVKQTGSSMKPLAVLVPAIDRGVITAGTGFDDVPYGKFKNYSDYKGLLTVRFAIANSQNIPMVKAMQMLGPENSIEFLKNAGITGLVEEDNNLSLALGGLTNGTSPLEMAAAYGAIANNGVYITPTFYTKVVDSNGNTILEPKQESRTIMSSSTAYIVKEILTETVRSGTSTRCAIPNMSTATKTGTTNSDHDRWLCGFTPYYTAATWYGYDRGEQVRGWSYNPAALIWTSVMKQAHSGLAGKNFASTRPNNIVTAKICKCSGLLATELCEEDERGDMSYTEYFVKGTAPTKTCECHVKVDICTETGLLANEYCPDVETKVFITRPDAETNKAWERANDAKYMLTVTETCTAHTQAPDTTRPVITLKGSNSVTLKVNETYKEEGATAVDDRDGDITSKISINGTVDTKKTGTYTLTYTVEDTAGNVATVTRVVTVIENPDNTTPNTTPSTNTNTNTNTNTTPNTNTSTQNEVTNSANSNTTVETNTTVNNATP